MKKRIISLLLVVSMLAGMLSITAGASTVGETESNDTTLTAQTLAFGDTVSGEISDTSDVDFYELTLAESGLLTISVTSYIEYYSLQLYESDGNELWYDVNNGYTESVEFRSDEYSIYLEAGTYYLNVNFP